MWPFKQTERPTVRVEPKSEPFVVAERRFRVGDETLAASTLQAAPRVKLEDVFRIPSPPPGMVPEGRVAMAQDDAFGGIAAWGMQGFSPIGAYAPFGGYEFFRGYAYLSELAQRPEYRRGVEIIAKEMTRKWIKLHSTDGDQDKSEYIAKLSAAMDDYRVQDVFREVAEHDGFFGRGQIYIDMGRVGPDELTKPLVIAPEKIAKGSLKRLKAIEPLWTYPGAYNAADPLHEHFYNPEMWYVQGRQLHHSRLLAVVSRDVPDILKPAYLFGGVSLTQLAEPYVQNWLRARQSVSNLMNAFSVMVLKTDMGSTIAGGPQTDVVGRVQAFNNFRDNRGTFVLDMKNEDFANVSAPIGGLDHLQAQAQEHMAAVYGIPLVKLFGITPSGLNACLPGDTTIATDRGLVQIRDVTTNDLVLTRRGLAPLTFAGITKYAKELIEIRTESKTLLCTDNHPIWLSEVGEFVPAENVLRGDRLLLIGEKPDAQNTPLLLHGAVNGGGDVWTGITPHGMQQHAAQFYSTGKFGKHIRGLCQKAATSITEMATKLTTSLIILSQCSRKLMLNFTTLNEAFALAHRLAPSLCSASNAETLSLSTSHRVVKNSALKNASWQTAGRVGHLRRSQSHHANVPNAAHFSQQSAATQSSVRVNAPPSVKIAQLTPTRIISLIQKNLFGRNLASFNENLVVSVRRVPASEWVYDLTVAPGYLPEFFANGILTHNSSDGEIRVFYDWINAQQEHVFSHPLRKIIDIIQLSEFGSIDPSITFSFEPLWEMTELDRANIRKTNADTAAVYVADGVIMPEEERSRLASEDEGQYDGLDLSVTPEPPVDPLEPKIGPGEKEDGDPDEGAKP